VAGDKMNGDRSNQTRDEQSPFSPPTLSLPKGGGALRGIGEKFAANPVTGTGSMTVPIATSPGRSGFGPQLSLSYGSGADNRAFGFGWDPSFTCITRKLCGTGGPKETTSASSIDLLAAVSLVTAVTQAI
jgi:hypothetical protein